MMSPFCGYEPEANPLRVSKSRPAFQIRFQEARHDAFSALINLCNRVGRFAGVNRSRNNPAEAAAVRKRLSNMKFRLGTELPVS